MVSAYRRAVEDARAYKDDFRAVDHGESKPPPYEKSA